MKGLRNLLLEEQFRLEKIIKEAKTRLEHAPEGRLRESERTLYTRGKAFDRSEGTPYDEANGIPYKHRARRARG